MATKTARPTRALSGLSMVEIHRELAKRERIITTLQRKKERLLKRIADIDADINANGGSSRGMGTRVRSRNETNLIDALAATLKGKTMSVTDAAEAVRKAGYQTTSPNFRTMVNAALLNKKKFRRVERGQYTAT